MIKAMMAHSGAMVSESTGVPLLTDVSIALSRIPRFGGHCRVEWTVLQHSLVCATLAAASGGSRRLCLAALLHDAHEALTGDVPSPLKPDSIKELQAGLDWRIMEAYFPGGPRAFFEEGAASVDYRALLAEAVTVGPPNLNMQNVEELFGGVPTAADMLAVRMIQGMTDYPLDARLLFHDRYDYYKRGILEWK